MLCFIFVLCASVLYIVTFSLLRNTKITSYCLQCGRPQLDLVCADLMFCFLMFTGLLLLWCAAQAYVDRTFADKAVAYHCGPSDFEYRCSPPEFSGCGVLLLSEGEEE